MRAVDAAYFIDNHVATRRTQVAKYSEYITRAEAEIRAAVDTIVTIEPAAAPDSVWITSTPGNNFCSIHLPPLSLDCLHALALALGRSVAIKGLSHPHTPNGPRLARVELEPRNWRAEVLQITSYIAHRDVSEEELRALGLVHDHKTQPKTPEPIEYTTVSCSTGI